MKQIVVVSGKGGTGKTTITTSLFARLPNAILADCDVDAPDTHILLKPEETSSEDFIGTRKAQIDSSPCSGEDVGISSRLCINRCRFQALSAIPASGIPVVNQSRCEGCGVCVEVCPVNAIKLVDTVVGRLAEADTLYGPMVHARLKPGEETSGKLVSEVRRRGRERAELEKADYLLADGSPGIGCPVISSLTGADLAVIVTEPSLSALKDMERLTVLLNQFQIPATVVINKWDISADISSRIESYCDSNNIDVAVKLPYEPKLVKAITRREIPSIALPDFFYQNGFENLIQRISNL